MPVVPGGATGNKKTPGRSSRPGVFMFVQALALSQKPPEIENRIVLPAIDEPSFDEEKFGLR